MNNRKLKNFKNPKHIFVRTIEKNFQEKLENFQLRFVGELAFEIFTPIWSHVNENEKYS